MSILEREATRAAWRRHHRQRGDRLDDVLVGPAAKVKDLCARFVVLPGDPDQHIVDDFDSELREWWNGRNEAPFGASFSWNVHTSGADHLTGARLLGDSWSSYLSLYRHGGIDVGTGRAAYDRGRMTEQRIRGFRLQHLVGLAWLAVDAQAAVAERFGMTGPWEFTVTLLDTADAELGDVAEGWREPDLGWRGPTCQDEHVVIRHELDDWPEEPDSMKALAITVGGNIEDAFGSGDRRFLASAGEVEGEIDLRGSTL